MSMCKGCYMYNCICEGAVEIKEEDFSLLSYADIKKAASDTNKKSVSKKKKTSNTSIKKSPKKQKEAKIDSDYSFNVFIEYKTTFLEVPLKMLKELNIENDISLYSYADNDKIYLSDFATKDNLSDMKIFRNALNNCKVSWQIDYNYIKNAKSIVRMMSPYRK